jgi:periplasmic protein TonB
MMPGHLLFSPPSEIPNPRASLGHSGGGGERIPIPATHGFLAPRSSLQLAPPRLPDNVTHVLAVPVATLDENAPPIVAAVPQLGLPWMAKDTDSAGPGQDGGIGSGTKGGMGDNSGSDAGEGESGTPYSRGMTMPVCVTCPYPLYTDEARKIKVQGTVTLRVLVGADGRAGQIHVSRGVGYGLDERAVETVRGWKFSPARDAARRVVPVWITIETVFRLF